MKKQILCAIAAMLAGSTCHAALFSGPSSFTVGPISQLGGVTNNLTLTDNANGFVVAGQVLVNVPATSSPIAGVLAAWTVDRPLGSFAGTMITTTVLSGFSAPPPGGAGNTNGTVDSSFTNYPGASLSQIPMSLVNGIDTPPWTNIVVSSSSFAYVSSGVNFLQQRFELDGIYLAGPGGTWTVDVPVTTIATTVPEPSTLSLLGLAVISLVGYRLRKRLA